MPGESQLPPDSQPDPSTATMDAIVRAARAERDFMLAHLENLTTRFIESDRRYEQRFDAQEKAVGAALTGAQQAVTKAETAAEKRFDNVNEFRASLADQAANLMPRSEATVLFNAIQDRLVVVEKRTQEAGARARGIGDAWGYLIGLVALTGAVVAIIVAVN